MRLFSGQNAAVLAWLGQKTDFTLDAHTHLIWALDKVGGQLLGAIGHGGRMGRVLGSLSIAIEEPRATLPLVRASARYLFGESRMRAAYVTIGSHRERWISTLKSAIGFSEVDRVRGGLNAESDLVVLKLTPERCRPWQAELRRAARQLTQEVA